MDAAEPEVMDFSQEVTFPDSDEEGGSNLVEVSEKTKKLLEVKFTQSVANDERKRAKGRFLHPKVAAVKTPRLDDFLKQEVTNSTKSLDKELAKIQTFVLDTVGPLTAILTRENAEQLPAQPWNSWGMPTPGFDASGVKRLQKT